MNEIRTERLLLRPWGRTMDDAHALLRLCSDEDVVAWTRTPAGYTLDDAMERLSRLTPVGEYRYAVQRAGEVVASVDVRSLGGHRAEIGYMAENAHRGHGYVAEAVVGLTRAFLPRFPRIEILTAEENVPSQRVAQRAGYAREGLLRGWRMEQGVLADRVMWAAVAGQWE